jgi:hypothetical protein
MIEMNFLLRAKNFAKAPILRTGLSPHLPPIIFLLTIAASMKVARSTSQIPTQGRYDMQFYAQTARLLSYSMLFPHVFPFLCQSQSTVRDNSIYDVQLGCGAYRASN